MKNNKGFTLIELLGSLIVMAIVAGIAYPIYTEITRENKDELFRDNVRNVISVVRTINVVEKGQTSGCLKDVEKIGIPFTGSWELVNDTIIIHNASDGYRSITEISEDQLKPAFDIQREATAETCS
jgi:prepilin-type N-terminal cleavage/methylation domain-containing protein